MVLRYYFYTDLVVLELRNKSTYKNTETQTILDLNLLKLTITQQRTKNVTFPTVAS